MKNKSMLLTVSGTTEKVVAVKTLVKMRLAKGFAESKREERSSFAAGRRASGEYYHNPLVLNFFISKGKEESFKKELTKGRERDYGLQYCSI